MCPSHKIRSAESRSAEQSRNSTPLQAPAPGKEAVSGMNSTANSDHRHSRLLGALSARSSLLRDPGVEDQDNAFFFFVSLGGPCF